MSWDAYVKGNPQKSYLWSHSVTANILKETLFEGKVKVFEDSNRTVMKTEILPKEGTVVVYKKSAPPSNMWRFEKIEIFSLDKQPLGTIDIFTEKDQFLNPHCRFMYLGAPIGSGSGDVDKHIAQKLLTEESIDPRYSQGSNIDQEVIDTIFKILRGKA